MSNLPKISIITPSYNQALFLEETIRSVLDQGYPDLEYIVIDGGSTDGSVEIIQKYASRLAYWVSEEDSGQVEAIQKGLNRATGEIIAWLNSDDLYTPGTLHRISRVFQEPEVAFTYGKCEFIDDKGSPMYSWPYHEELDLKTVITHNFLPQPSCFWRMDVYRTVGPLNATLHYAFDYEYWLRILLAGYKTTSVPVVFSLYRLHDESKTCTAQAKFEEEMVQIHDALLPERSAAVRKAVARCYRRFATENYFWRHDRKRAMKFFRKMFAVDPTVCDLTALKVCAKCLLRIPHRASGGPV